MWFIEEAQKPRAEFRVLSISNCGLRVSHNRLKADDEDVMQSKQGEAVVLVHIRELTTGTK